MSGDTLQPTKATPMARHFELFQPARVPLCWSANRGLLAEASPSAQGALRRCDEHYYSSVCWSPVARR
jgi:hypothetical protein